MTTVLTRCPDDCGEISIPADTIRVTIYGNNTWFSTSCPKCGLPFCRTADDTILERLASAGIKPRLVLPSPRPTIDGQPPTGPALTNQDRLDLMIDLARTADPVAELTS